MTFQHRVIQYSSVDFTWGKPPSGKSIGKPFADLKKALAKARLLNKQAKTNNQPFLYYVKGEVA